MEHRIFPIGFYCHNVRLCLKKDAMARKCHAMAEEMENLKNFKALVSKSIFLHPLYSEKKGARHIVQHLGHLANAKKRLLKLESNSMCIPRRWILLSMNFHCLVIASVTKFVSRVIVESPQVKETCLNASTNISNSGQDNSFVRAPPDEPPCVVLHACYTKVSPLAKVEKPKLVVWFESIVELLDLNPREFDDDVQVIVLPRITSWYSAQFFPETVSAKYCNLFLFWVMTILMKRRRMKRVQMNTATMSILVGRGMSDVDRKVQRTRRNVKMDVFDAFIDLLHQTRNVTKEAGDPQISSPLWMLKQEVPKLVESLNRQLREKLVKTKVGAFSVLKELVVVLLNYLAKHMDPLANEELRRYSLQALESFVLRCPKDVSVYFEVILDLALKYLSYDPNFTDNMEEDVDNGTQVELAYFNQGGILPYVIKELIGTPQ
eukprot:Gb_31621 [translate_table: standard]